MSLPWLYRNEEAGMRGFGRGNRKLGKVFIIPVCAVLILATGILTTFYLQNVRALINDEDTVHVSDSQIGMSSLIVGTYIMYLGAVTDELYATAMQSAEQAGVYEIYYKSELADGAWYEISGAEGLADITTSGTMIPVSTIENLNLQYYTKEDGITYDLRTGSAVNIFDIDDPYDLYNSSVMEDIKLQYDILSDKEEKTKSDEYYMDILDDFFSADVKNAETTQLDEEIDALFSIYQQADESMREQLMSVMKELDDERRAMVSSDLLDGGLAELLDKAGLYSSSDEEITMNSQVFEAVSAALKNAAEEADSKASYSDENSGLSQTDSELTQSLIDAAKQGNSEECKNICDKLEALDNIRNGSSGSLSTELEVLDELTQKQYIICEELLTKTKDYDNIKNAGSDTVLKKYLNEKKQELDRAFNELADMTDKAVARLGRDEAENYIEVKLAGVRQLVNEIPSDAFESYAKASVEKYEERLVGAYAKLAASGSNRMDSLTAAREEAILDRLDALDRNDYDAAYMHEIEIENYDEQIAEYEKELTAIIDSPNSTDAQRQSALAQLDSTSMVAAINNIGSEAVEDIQYGDFSTVADRIDMLADFSSSNPSTVLNNLKDIYSELAGAEFNMQLTQDEQNLIEDAKEQIVSALTQNAMTFAGNSITVDSIYAAVKDIMGHSFDLLDDREKAAVLVGVATYAQTIGSEVLLNVASSMASKMYGDNNIYIYRQLQDEISVYVSCEALAKVTGYRYIYSDTKKNVILQNGIEYYSFTAFDDVVGKRDAGSDSMPYPAKLQGTVYIPDEYVSQKFRCDSYYIEKSVYAIIIPEDMTDEIMDFTSSFIRELIR